MSDIQKQLEDNCKSIKDKIEAGQFSFDDILDIEYTIYGNGELKDFELAVTIGGPNIFITSDTVEGYWGNSKCVFNYRNDNIFDRVEDMYNALRNAL